MTIALQPGSSRVRTRALLAFCAVLLGGCLGLPEGVQPVANFETERYLGTWYEVARLDHSFERGLERVTATYSLREDGGLTVVNRGFSTDDDRWQEARGKAYFVADESTGHLKVSFFGPFYGSYVVFELDPEYRHAFVAGANTSYLWLLARTPHPAPQLIERFTQRAKALGFATDELIFPQPPPAGD
ncbi:MAG: lipocalin family protein [Halioglobus sp.]|nr:lipocalin family protein [Halioglobus sp.]